MNIINLKIEKILPYPKNAKKHTTKQIKQVAESILEFGWGQPIVVDKAGVIIVGHGRFEAAKLLGLADVPVIELDIPPKKANAYRLADNKLNESDWDMGLVIEELKLLEDNMLVKLTGFSSDLLLDPNAKDDEIPEDVPARSKVGDLYELGGHRLLCGDSTQAESVLRLMDGKKADMIFTDPPYNVDYEGGGKKTSNKILNDKMSDAEFNTLLHEAFKRQAEVSKSSAPWYVCHSHTTQAVFEKTINETEWNAKTQIIWEKPSATMGWQEYRQRHEVIFYCVPKFDTPPFYGDRTGTTIWKQDPTDQALLSWLRSQIKKDYDGTTTVWTIGRENVNDYEHPTQKPVALVMRAIVNSSKADDIVLDLFSGGGSTLIACEKTDRICYGMELDPKYIDVIVQRYVDYTGDEEIKKNGKEITWTKSRKQ